MDLKLRIKRNCGKVYCIQSLHMRSRKTWGNDSNNPIAQILSTTTWVNDASGSNDSELVLQQIKNVWEELNNFRPMFTYGKSICGGVKQIVTHYKTEYMMSFLMGLNKTFTQTRGQILLMDQLSSIRHAFTLVS